MSEQHTTDQRATVLPYCDQCEHDHPSRIAADGTIVCLHEDGGAR